MIRKIDHFVITTGKVADCLAFYGKLGFTARDAGGRYELFAGDFKINVHLLGHELAPKAQQVTPGSADLCLEIEGTLEDCRAALLAAGLTLLEDICPRTGAHGPMRSIYLRDPDGNLIELSSYR